MSATLLTGIARTTEPRTVLRRFLALDAVVTGANGLAYAAVSGPLGRLLGVDGGFLLGLGLALLVYGAAVGALAARRDPAPAAVTAVVDANLVYAVVSAASLALWLDPTTAGAVWIPLQGAVVALFAVLQYAALRATRR
ncbi:hypothetical protein [Streptomyces clavuligerus]|uniref:Putative integral membrane protein n=1 Tax=Streptomyces clavuligerus TaxID=1901 RepID=E2PX90_STRCL|nr:hypothetical protein [Streptomyces clavuligerus]ANW17356.1 hypothetical protein BB341_03525 [Streptomyces clavuligerus]AXU11906.1 hypothetical protein D1794_03695 [Streptomyces clavuligerus]EFG10167.1 Putative integral membrane protein [Streptomyces clavuligerus]MBY6301747.1 hypothetical protein [Streptomyces clavuligerus]QCS04686.1 hypothetical protein CRV15_03125 [Streptomyces clavuligerus]